MSFYRKARNEGHAGEKWDANRGLRRDGPAGAQRRVWSAHGWAGHARLQPTLGDGKQPGDFGGGKGLVKAKHAAIATVALGALDGERGAEAAAIGRVCRGRNDVLAHGDGCLGNWVHSGETQARAGLREHQGITAGCSSTVQLGDKDVAKGGQCGRLKPPGWHCKNCVATRATSLQWGGVYGCKHKKSSQYSLKF